MQKIEPTMRTVTDLYSLFSDSIIDADVAEPDIDMTWRIQVPRTISAFHNSVLFLAQPFNESLYTVTADKHCINPTFCTAHLQQKKNKSEKLLSAAFIHSCCHNKNCRFVCSGFKQNAFDLFELSVHRK